VRAVIAVLAKLVAWPVVISVMTVLVVTILIAAMLGVVTGIASTANCGPSAGGTVNTQTAAKQGESTGLEPEQLVNAAHIMNAGAKLGLSVRDQQIGVMTALGESGLRVLDHGDTAGPDSRGLFQQRDNWGPLADRMNAEKSATLFFQAMIQKVPEAERQTLQPTEVAHRVQINADPNHYTKWWTQAVSVVQALGGTDGASCDTEGVPGVIGTDGWAMPAAGPVTSPYGLRPGPYPNHTGTDFEAGGCGGPIWAAKDGTVTFVGLDSLQNGVVYIDHGDGLETRYVHMYLKDIFVKNGQKVRAGEQIAKTGSSGASTGCHLHFEILNGGQFVDPIPVLAAAGITY
jgi:hypothetical protein